MRLRRLPYRTVQVRTPRIGHDKVGASSAWREISCACVRAYVRYGLLDQPESDAPP